MLPKEQIERINALANKSKTKGLTIQEQVEQKKLRDAYIEAFRGGMKKTIEGVKIVDEEGTDVTPEKLKEIQKNKGLHGR
ncbi:MULTISPECIES: DUF896 family protein [Carnobacterium]|uniref:UPF0291 protein SAMN05878443_1486 n=1 Tax=Carnobacterium alterfunditum TaxID=28230 RepID=A0A1N6GXC0_9LACT|nr:MULTISPECIES: DUF896 family protein [Carnobacterium]MBT2731495.1 DUF896 family protein [Carnobacterium sp. ISL-102]SIO12146.1 Uncharacterized protein YnzC, UPF0291/DUF896 family [Carnobacterium alterfunditum]